MDTFSQIQTVKLIAALAIAFFSYRKFRVCQRNLQQDDSDGQVSDTFSSHSEQSVKESKQESQPFQKKENEKEKKISIQVEDPTNEPVDVEDLFKRREAVSSEGIPAKSRRIEKEKRKDQKGGSGIGKVRQGRRIRRGPRKAKETQEIKNMELEI